MPGTYSYDALVVAALYILLLRHTHQIRRCGQQWIGAKVRVGQGFWVYGILQLKYGYSVYHFL